MTSFTTRQRIAGHLRLMRPYAWIWFDALPIAVLYTLFEPAEFSLVRLSLTIAMMICLDSGATTLNDVFDVDSDRLSEEPSRRERPIVTGLVSCRAAIGQGVVLMALAVISSVVIGGWMILAGGLTIFLGVAYSTPPFRFNAKPWSSQPFWLVFGSSQYLIVAAAAGSLFSIHALLWLIGYFGFFAVGENLAKDIRDWDNDASGNKVTLVVKLGPARAARISRIGGLVGIMTYSILVGTSPLVHPWVTLFIVLLLGWWAKEICLLTGAIERAYDKAAAKSLHTVYIRSFMWFHVLCLLGMLPSVWPLRALA